MSRILIVNSAKRGIWEFAEPIEKIVVETGSEPIFIEHADCLKFNFQNIDGAILTGSPQGNDIVEHHLPYFQWIKDFNKPILGICAGHHVTGFMFGSTLLRSQEPESGDFEIEIIKTDQLFTGMPASFIVKQMHNDSITLPDEFELLATSKSCFNQLMKHKKKTLYTCQFHPEFYNHELIRNFIKLCI